MDINSQLLQLIPFFTVLCYKVILRYHKMYFCQGKRSMKKQNIDSQERV